MKRFNVTGVSGTPSGAGYELVKPEEQKIGTIPVGQRSSRGGGSKPVDINTYGNDIANFANFKGKDKYDAMSFTTSAANDVKKAYMQLQHEFPDIVLDFESMPDPAKCGKKREGFNIYKQNLENWKNLALQQISDAREQSTAEIAGMAVDAINANTDADAAMNMGVTTAAAEAIIENDNKNAKQINKNVHDEGAAIRDAVHGEGAVTRDAVHGEGAATRDAVYDEGAVTRAAVHDEGKQTRKQIEEEADRIIDTLDPLHVNRAVKSIRDAAARAGEAVEDFISKHPEAVVGILGGGISGGAAALVAKRLLGL